jgi:hypothetical protein
MRAKKTVFRQLRPGHRKKKKKNYRAARRHRFNPQANIKSIAHMPAQSNIIVINAKQKNLDQGDPIGRYEE